MNGTFGEAVWHICATGRFAGLLGAKIGLGYALILKGLAFKLAEGFYLTGQFDDLRWSRYCGISGMVVFIRGKGRGYRGWILNRLEACREPEIGALAWFAADSDLAVHYVR